VMSDSFMRLNSSIKVLIIFILLPAWPAIQAPDLR
jgi:hypothetical protein